MMRYGWRDLPAVLGNPVGRHQLMLGQLHRLWPLTSRLAGAYRRTLIAGTRVVAVVGSAGKSTTTRAVTVALGNPLHPHIEVNEKALLPSQVLRIRPGRRHAVIETAIDARGQMAAFVRMIRPDVCVVTTIGSAHSDTLGSLDVTLAEKALAVQVLPRTGVAVLNRDDSRVASMAALTRASVITYGLGPGSDVRAADIVTDWTNGTRFRVHCDGRTWDASSSALGPGAVYSTLAAVAVAHAEGIAVEDALGRLAALPPPAGRMEVVHLESGAILLDDTSHSTLESIHGALDFLERIPAVRKVVVLGDPHYVAGKVREIYRQIGARVGEVSARAILVNGSGDIAQCYRSGAAHAGLARDRITVAIRDVPRAIEILRSELADGDVVLIQGRGYQRLDRIALALAGRTVRCDLPVCRVPALECTTCSMLERGWQLRRPVF